MADQDGDSQMISSPSSSDPEGTPKPLNPTQLTSPPDSQHRNTAMPTSASGSAIANANGKRPLNTISNGADESEDLVVMQQAGLNGAGGSSNAGVLGGAAGKGVAKQEFPTKTHERSGYQWSRAEDEPGYAWMNKKSLDEYHRAFEGLVHKDHVVRGRYGDPFEAADKEKAILNSLKQQ